MTSRSNINENDKLILEQLSNFYDLKLHYVDELNVFSDDVDYYMSGIRVVIVNNSAGKLSISYTEADFDLDKAKDLKSFIEMIYELSALTHLQLFIENFVFVESKLQRYELEPTPMPSGIKKLPQLRSLSICSSNFSQLPNDIGQLVELKYLNFARTEIDTIPKSFFDLNDLHILITANSKISSVTLKEIKMKMPHIKYIVSENFGPFWNDNDFDLN